MIQRIQSFWLLLASLAGFLTMKYPFFTGMLASSSAPAGSMEQLTAISHIIQLLLTAAISLIALITIFLFKDRKKQVRLTIVALILSVANLILYFVYSRNFTSGHYALSSVYAFALPVLLFVAVRGIAKDQKLVKELDRLR